MKRFLLILYSIAVTCLLLAQSTIDRHTYVNKYRIKGAFLSKPLPKRTARSLSAPVCVNGYLWVYPIDLGYFTYHPDDVIAQLNAQKKYGRNNWRIPTSSELMTMEDNAATIGLGDDIYMATSHSNGILRLVSIEGEVLNCVKVGNTYWLKTNLGAKKSGEIGSVVSYEDAIRYCPAGYRLPTKAEYEELLASGKARFSNILGNSNAELYFPARDVATFYMNETWRESGDYFIQGNSYSLYFGQYRDAGYLTTHKPEIRSGGLSKGMVRYVMDK